MKTKYFLPSAALVAAACTEPTSPDAARQGDSGLRPATAMSVGQSFESGETMSASWSPQRLATSPGTASKASTSFLGRFLNEVVTLSVPAGSTSITLAFDLYAIGSWDGAGKQGFGADRWQLEVRKGTGPLENLFHTSFSNQPTKPQNYPRQVTEGGTRPSTSGAVQVNSLGYGKSSGKNAVGDATYRMSVTVSNPTAAAVVFYFHTTTPLQDINDESWGLDNVSISGN